MTREQFDKASELLSHYNIAETQLELLEFFEEDMEHRTTDSLVPDFTNILYGILKDNPNGKSILHTAIESMKNLLVEQMSSLTDDFYKL